MGVLRRTTDLFTDSLFRVPYCPQNSYCQRIKRRKTSVLKLISEFPVVILLKYTLIGEGPSEQCTFRGRYGQRITFSIRDTVTEKGSSGTCYCGFRGIGMCLSDPRMKRVTDRERTILRFGKGECPVSVPIDYLTVLVSSCVSLSFCLTIT